MTHHVPPRTTITPRPLNGLDHHSLERWHQANLAQIARLDQQIRESALNGGSTVFSQFISKDTTVLSTAKAVK